MARLTSRLLQGAVFTGIAAALAMACSASGGGNEVGNHAGSGGTSSGGSGTGAGTGNGGSSNTGGSGAGINLGGSSNSGGSGGGSAGTCAADSYDGKQLPLDMYIMMDKSGSMGSGSGSSWDQVKSALTTFVNSGTAVTGIGVGIQFFPLGSSISCNLLPPCNAGCINYFNLACIPDPNNPQNSAECNPQTYLPPAVTIQKLPGVASQIVAAMNNVSTGGGTPTVPAMQSAAQATTGYAKQHPSHKVIIVLATDGDPNDCNSDVAGVAKVADAAYKSTPSVMTFVIGIGNVSGLNTIAAAGGSKTAIIVSSGSASQDFLKAMNDIRGKALGCDFLLPTPTGGGTVDPNKVNVFYTPVGGSRGIVFQVSDQSQCGQNPGWYYAKDSAGNKIIRLCPASCDAVTNNGGKVDIELGCKTQIAPPT